MRLRHIIGAAAALALVSGTAHATPYGENDGDEYHLTSPVRGVFLARAGDNAAERAMQTDLAFAQNMARHHQGAIDMANAYLSDRRGTNPILRRLAQGIIHNQAFEIAVLEVVRKDVERGPRPVPGAPNLVSLARGWDGLEHEWYFVKAPPPGAVDLWLSPGLRASEFDVQFARPMIQHHSMAIDMAMAYNKNPDGGNPVLGKMNYDIMQDQRVEIAFLRRMIARYSGDPQSVRDDDKMMDLMHRSMTGMSMGAAGHGGQRSQSGQGSHTGH